MLSRRYSDIVNACVIQGATCASDRKQLSFWKRQSLPRSEQLVGKTNDISADVYSHWTESIAALLVSCGRPSYARRINSRFGSNLIALESTPSFDMATEYTEAKATFEQRQRE